MRLKAVRKKVSVNTSPERVLMSRKEGQDEPSEAPFGFSWLTKLMV